MASITQPLTREAFEAALTKTLAAAGEALFEAEEEHRGLKALGYDVEEQEKKLDSMSDDTGTLRYDIDELEGRVSDTESAVEDFERELGELHSEVEDQGKQVGRKITHLRELLEHLTDLVQQRQQVREPRLLDVASIQARLAFVSGWYAAGPAHGVHLWAEAVSSALEHPTLMRRQQLLTLELLDILIAPDGTLLDACDAKLVVGQVLVVNGQPEWALGLGLVDNSLV